MGNAWNDESIKTPTNSQKDRVYANVAVKRGVPVACLLKCRKHFSQIMISVIVSSLGKKRHWCLFILEPKPTVVITVTSSFLNQGLLPDIQKLSGNNFTFQQNGAAAHCSLQTVCVFASSCVGICGTRSWPPCNSADLNPVDYSIWGALQQLVYRRRRIRDVERLKEVLQSC